MAETGGGLIKMVLMGSSARVRFRVRFMWVWRMAPLKHGLLGSTSRWGVGSKQSTGTFQIEQLDEYGNSRTLSVGCWSEIS